MKIINDIMATRLLFFIMAFFVGLWTIRIPTIKDQINTDYFGIGLVMATFAIGSIIAMIFANNVIKMSSTRTVLLYTSILQAILWLPTPFISSLQLFMIFSFIFGLCYGSFEISCNLYASNLEKREKKSMMSGFHAFWSLGVLTGSIATSLFLEWNISFLNNVITYVIILLPLNIFIVLKLHVDQIENTENKHTIFFIWPLLIFILALIAMVNALTEGSVDAWGALYMRDFIQVDGFLIGLATVSFNIFMVIGRLSGDWIRDRIGVYNFLTILFITSILSLYILYSFDSILAALCGFALLGIGTSAIIPIAYSLAGKAEGVDSGAAIAIISIAVYGTFMGAPATLGIIANNYGVNSIFFPILIIFLFILPIIFASRRLFTK
ncbi:MAG: MFS transporter [Pelagibacterales bacterium]|nr:MFS transporter [Pelagibacterales bacterium]MBL6675270.1 MFS transporter [Alphaproteobacteria bacterium]